VKAGDKVKILLCKFTSGHVLKDYETTVQDYDELSTYELRINLDTDINIRGFLVGDIILLSSRDDQWIKIS
jgi:hypothetical protein